MTTEIEKTFFDTFGIEPKYKTCVFKYCKNKKEYDCENCNDREWHYPQITDSILLGLVVIMTRYTDIIEGFDSVDELKNFVLTDLMYSLTQSEADIVKQQVQALFKEG